MHHLLRIREWDTPCGGHGIAACPTLGYVAVINTRRVHMYSFPHDATQAMQQVSSMEFGEASDCMAAGSHPQVGFAFGPVVSRRCVS
jgi:hypothetical protein